jgi:hypothetical protein
MLILGPCEHDDIIVITSISTMTVISPLAEDDNQGIAPFLWVAVFIDLILFMTIRLR